MYLLIADDLTGSNDAGVQFAKRGIDTRLALSAGSAFDLETVTGAERMLVINANTRNLSAENAAAYVRTVIAGLRATESEPPSMVFKKMDSTLRGNPGAEMDAVMDGFGFRTAFLAPAYPQQGRTVVDGALLVNGVPLHQTGFANDPLTPVSESSVIAIMGRQTRRKMGFVPLAALEAGKDATLARLRELAVGGAECILFDAAAKDHLSIIAEAGLFLKERPLFVGSAGLADAVASHLPQASASRATTPDLPAGKVFFICGSANQATHDQTAALAAAGVPVIRMPENVLENGIAVTAAAVATTKVLEKGSAVLATPLGRIGTAGSMAEGIAISTALSAMVMDVLGTLGENARSAALVLTGGETAFTVLQRLGGSLALHRELASGIVLCTVAGGPWNGLRVITKAGGFGAPETFLKLLNMLQQCEAA